MANQERNGRNVAVPDENRPTWRPQDESGQRNRRNMSDDDRDWEMSDDRSIERYGQGQSGYGAGRYEGDRSYGSRNQASALRENDQSHDRGTDDRFTGGRGGSQWSPTDRGDRGMYGSHGNYGHTGHWTDDTGGGYLGQSGTQMGYGREQYQGSGGWQGQGGSGYNERGYGRGGPQDRFGSQGYQGYGQPQQPQHHHRYGGRAIGEPRYGHPGQHGYGQGFGQGGYGGFSGHGMATGFSDQGGSGYGYQPEHDSGFRGGERWDENQNFNQHRMRQGTGYSSAPVPPSQEARYPFPESGEPMYSHEAMYGNRAATYRGAHRGKGPSGYARSDERIREMVCDVLTDHHDIDASHIEVSVKGGEVTLAGSVEDRRTKRLAEDVIENVSGVKEVVNQLRVSERRTMSSSSTERTGSNGGPAVERSPAEQSIQSGAQNGDKRHRA